MDKEQLEKGVKIEERLRLLKIRLKKMLEIMDYNKSFGESRIYINTPENKNIGEAHISGEGVKIALIITKEGLKTEIEKLEKEFVDL